MLLSRVSRVVPSAAAAWKRPAQRNCRRLLSTESSASTATATSKQGPPIKKALMITTGIMFGIPSVIGAAFVYNLKTDDDFYEHFLDKYPDLIAFIDKYYPLTEDLGHLTDRNDIGDVSSISELQQETRHVIVTFASGQQVGLEVHGTMKQHEIEALARQQVTNVQSGDDVDDDKVIFMSFSDQDSSTSQQAQDEAKSSARVATTGAAPGMLPPNPHVAWGRKSSSSSSSSSTQHKQQSKATPSPLQQARQELQTLRLQQQALEQSKFTSGREIDQVDAEIAQLEQRKAELKQFIKSNQRFLFIF